MSGRALIVSPLLNNRRHLSNLRHPGLEALKLNQRLSPFELRRVSLLKVLKLMELLLNQHLSRLEVIKLLKLLLIKLLIKLVIHNAVRLKPLLGLSLRCLHML